MKYTLKLEKKISTFYDKIAQEIFKASFCHIAARIIFLIIKIIYFLKNFEFLRFTYYGSQINFPEKWF
jgi:hypothetical protein